MIIYIAGKMVGLPGKGRAEFYQVEQELREKGHVVLNPAKLPDGLREHSYMPICLSMLQQADAIYLLENWRDSPGAKLELDFARYQGKRILMDEDRPLHRSAVPLPCEQGRFRDGGDGHLIRRCAPPSPQGEGFAGEQCSPLQGGG